MKVTVIGSGNGAYGLAFHLVQLGHDVLIYSREKSFHNISAIKQTGQIEALKTHNKIQAAIHGTSKIACVTTDIRKAMEFSYFIMLIVPAEGQKETFTKALPYLEPGHIWVSLPGNFAFIDYIKAVKEGSNIDTTKDLPFTLVETGSIPYACRKVGGNQVFVNGVKKAMHFGVYPSSRTKATLEKITPFFTLEIQTAKNVVAAGLCCLNLVIHPPITTYNAGWIETRQGDFLFHREGGSKGVLSLMNGLDQERLMWARALNLEIDDLLTVWKGWYGDKKSKSLKEFLQHTPFYDTIKAPSSLHTRYFTEDLNYLLIPLMEYFKINFQIQSPIAEAIVLSAKYLSGLELKNLRNLNDFPRALNEL